MSTGLLFEPLDSPGPNAGQPITQQLYTGVLSATLLEARAKPGLYLTTLEDIPSVQTEALMLPAGMAWNPVQPDFTGAALEKETGG